ncbi:MAG: VOC family protein [Caldilineaceae bacterium]|nr:VOC family protein [Caldilineaceae bacterium]
MSTAKLGITQIGQIALRAQDLERAVIFYRDVLELPFLFSTGDLAFLQCGEVRLMLSRPESAAVDHPGSIIYYKVTDIQQTYDQLRNQEVQFIDEPHLIAKMPDHELWMVFFYDTEGNTLALMAEVRE